MKPSLQFLALAITLSGCGGGQPSPSIVVPQQAPSLAGEPAADCAPTAHPGGDWPSLNHDLSNTRHQPHERVIHTGNVGSLAPAWKFSVREQGEGATGTLQSTPVVANGCVYFSTSTSFFGPRGDIFALNADTGEVVWHSVMNGLILGLTVANGMVYAIPTNAEGGFATFGGLDAYIPVGSHAVALDASTGEQRWISERLDDGNAHNGTYVNASPVVFSSGGRELMFAPMAGGFGDGARIPMFLLDALTGATVKKSFSLTEAEYAAGYGGTGMWSTAAFDPDTGHLYAGTSDSDAFTMQHPYNNAVLKIDADPRRVTFGSVVDAYSGVSEYYDLDQTIPGVFENNPACTPAGGALPVHLPGFDSSSAIPCLEGDYDFGASPNLFVDANGEKRIAAMQKAGILHVIEARTMEVAWKRVAGAPGPVSNGATGAVDGSGIYMSITPNVLLAYEATAGGMSWVSSIATNMMTYHPLTVANGVLYSINNGGVLLAFDAASGMPLLERPISSDAGQATCFGMGGGIAIARNTLYVPCDDGAFNTAVESVPPRPGALVAYRLAP